MKRLESSRESRRTHPGGAVAGRDEQRGRLLSMLGLLALCAGIAAAALTVGYFLGRHDAPAAAGGESEESGASLWTCSMDPQIKLPKPGKCPICFMPLIPLEQDADGDGGPRQLRMSEEAVALADIQTVPVKRQYVTKAVRMVGKVDYDETRLADITAWIPGRLDRLYVDYTNVTVRKGDHLFSMYSPDLIVAQRELLLGGRNDHPSGPDLEHQLALDSRELTEAKLRRWGLFDEQIEEIKRRGTPSDHMTIYAPAGGIVIRRHANEGAYVQEGTPIYTIADLSQVWVYLDAYESDDPWLRYGQQVEFTTESYPGEIFKGRIAQIDPVLNEKTRTVKVRVNVSNADQKLKPGMFVHAIVQSKLAAGGRVLDSALAGKWICPMHPEIVKDEPEKCDLCEMALVPAEELGFVAPDQAPQPPLVIPATAPLRTGKRAVVYVKLPDRDQPAFEGREVLLGYRAGEHYLVRYGLEEGEEVVTVGNFKIDSALEIQARPSMMAPGAPLPPLSAKVDVPGGFRVALAPLVESYLAAGKALAADDLPTAREALRGIVEEIDKIRTESLGPEVLSSWEAIRRQVIFAAYETLDATDKTTARRHFKNLSQMMLRLVESFGHALPDPIHLVHCQMAFENEGADWLQTGREVLNPYFGPAMLHCGEIQLSFPPASDSSPKDQPVKEDVQ